MKRCLFLLTNLLSICLYATHIAGGHITYKAISNNQYIISLTLYRDCNCTSCADFDNTAYIAIFDTSNNLITQTGIPFPGKETISNPYTDGCPYKPTICMDKAVYSDTVTLQPNNNYTVVYQRCCFATLQNIVADQGFTLATRIVPGNSSPEYDTIAPLYVRVNMPFNIPLSAHDADGDTLKYSLCSIWSGADANCVNPSPDATGGCPTTPTPPPYTDIIPHTGLGLPNMQQFAGNLEVDSITGELRGTPTVAGSFIVGVRAKDYRNNIAVSETRHNFIIYVISCNSPQTGIEPVDKPFVSIHPNPAKNYLHVNTGNLAQLVEIFDLQGKLLKNLSPNTIDITFNTESLIPGNYILRVQHNDSISTHLITIE